MPGLVQAISCYIMLGHFTPIYVWSCQGRHIYDKICQHMSW